MKVAINKAKMYRNVRDFIDETASKAIPSMQRAGEIWTSTRGDEYLILSAHPGHCQVLKLFEYEPTGRCIPVTSRCMRYTCPSMVQYMTGNMFQDYVKNVPAEEYQRVMQDVAEALNVEIRVSQEAVEASDQYRAMEAKVERYAKALLKTKDQLESAREEIVELKSRSEEWEAPANNMESSPVEVHTAEDDALSMADVWRIQAEMYRDLYHKLLDKVMAMKGA
ncbi:MAG: hypothetical protein ACI4WX_00815 [Aristaeellaceae bacterium]